MSVDTRVYKPSDFAGSNVIQFRCCAGIGDIHWVITKIHGLRQMLGTEVLVSVAAKNELRRAEEFIQLLSPNVRFAGWDSETTSFETMQNSLGDDWPDCNGKYDFILNKPHKINLACNLWLERGKSLQDWLPKLPLNWHYPINIPREHVVIADQIMHDMGPNVFFVYPSNRDKDSQVRPGWNIWNTEEWVEFLSGVNNHPACKGFSFLVAGSSWDADRTQEVTTKLQEKGYKAKAVIGKHLGIVLECMKRCKFSFHFPGGLGLLANCLRVPTFFMLPRILKQMEKNIADPMDIAYDNFKVMVRPTVSDALTWWHREGFPANFG
jgi:hypothetical protein